MRQILLSIVVCICSVSLLRCNATEIQSQQPLIGWRIMLNGQDKGFLLPSIHLSSQFVEISRHDVASVVRNVDAVYVEFDNTNNNEVAKYREMMITLPTLEAYLTQQEKDTVKEAVARYGFDSNIIYGALKSSPFSVLNLLSSACISNISSANGIDSLVIAAAHQARKPIKSMESMRSLKASILSVPKHEWEKYLMNVASKDYQLSCKSNFYLSINTLYRLYHSGDISKICSEQREDHLHAYGSGAVFDNIVTSHIRNDTFSREIVQALSLEGKTLFLLGASHFGCTESILTQLSSQNSKLQFVPLSQTQKPAQ